MIQLHYSPATASLAPHLLLEEIGAPFELVPVDRERNAHKSEAYLKLNPTGLIPTLVDGGLVLHQAAAICLHLADQYPAARMAPGIGNPLRPLYCQWLVYLTNTLQAELITYFYPERMADDAAMAARVKAHAERRVGAMLDLLDTHLAAKGPYMLGADCSAVDLYLFMLCRWTRAHALPAQTRPNLARLMQGVAARPAVQRVFAREQLPLPWF